MSRPPAAGASVFPDGTLNVPSLDAPAKNRIQNGDMLLSFNLQIFYITNVFISGHTYFRFPVRRHCLYLSSDKNV